MTGLLERPLFTWITLEHRATLDGRIEVRYEPYLVLDPQAVAPFVAAVGARRWRILETLALLSEADPNHALRRVVRATIPDLLSACAGPDSGWSESTMAGVIKSLEEDGYLIRELGRKRGRKGGQEKTTWILADGLFAMPSVNAAVAQQDTNMLPRLRDTAIQDPENRYPETYEPQKLGIIPNPESLTNNDSQISGPREARLHHGTTWMSNPSMGQMEQPRAILADGTTNDLLLMAVTRALRGHGWTTDVGATTRKHGLLRTAAFLWYASNPKNGVKTPGAFIRMRLKESPDAWPDTWIDGSQITVTETGQIEVLSAENQIVEPPQISTAQVMEVFTSLPASEQTRLRDAAAAHLPTDPSARADAWRNYLAEIFSATGLLESAS